MRRLLSCLLGFALFAAANAATPALSDERLVLQTALGDIELAFFPDVAPVTVAHSASIDVRLAPFSRPLQSSSWDG
jgi:hypothetical protein